MSILQELMTLLEEKPIELHDVIKYFPKHHGKALSKLWGGTRLMWHGDRFFGDGDLGPAYHKALEAAEKYMKDGYNTEVQMEVEGPDGDSEEMNIDVQFKDEEPQECYLGYSPKYDKLYIGFDCGVSESDFNDEFDRAFEQAHGESNDIDNEKHAAIFNKVWEDYKREKYSFWGLIFEITHDGEKYQAEEFLPPDPGGFYHKMYRHLRSMHPDIVDLRLG
jgi:hypothetical protein